MKGAVAAGHPLTAEAGARILAAGGNAVDACIAAAFVSWVAESPLTGPGAGGFMLVHRARDRSDRILDFGVAAPGRGLPRDAGGEMDAVEVTFAPDAIQVFLIGAASCAVPGAIPGLEAAHASYGRLPWRELVAPAVEAARAGVRLSGAQAFLHLILDGVLRHEPAGRAVYGGDAPLDEGEVVAMPELADTLERLGAEGARLFTHGELARATSAAVLEHGGRITEEDLASYRVIRRRPVRIRYRDVEFTSNPPPSSGGILIAFALRVLDRLGPMPPAGSADALAVLAETMREGARAREGGFFAGLYRGGAARRLLADDRVGASAEVVRSQASPARRERAGLPS
ncbi:MAG TPA: gamma-glutamyltransferase, partial [Gaiellaceae bacterium]|nr:gamma-glutamyltransferase [Gaiellaceae bacterium]